MYKWCTRMSTYTIHVQIGLMYWSKYVHSFLSSSGECTVLSQSIICLSKLQPWKRARFQSLFVITKGQLRLFIFQRSQLVLMLDKLYLVKLKLIRNNKYPFYSLPSPMKRRISCFYAVFFSPIGQRLGPDWSVQLGGLFVNSLFQLILF